MLFDTSFRKDLARSFGISLVVLATIVLTFALIKTLSLAAGGRVDPADVLLALTFAGLTQLPPVLALALFIAVVASVGRLYRDSEMAVWMASGQPLRRFVAPVLRMAWPVLLGLTALQLWVSPWTQRETVQMRDRYEKRSDLSRVAPGQFQSSRDGSKVFFIERESDTPGMGRNVFILTQKPGQESVTSAANGQIEWDGDDRYLLLRDGQRNETDLSQGGHALARFERYRVLADRQVTRSLDELPPKAMTSLALLQSPQARHRAALVWRIGMVLGALNLTLLGLGLAASNPRRPNNWGLLAALLVFIIYFQLINLSEGWVAQEKAQPVQALLILHGSVALLALAMLYVRDEGLRLSAWLRRRPAA
jgi:lipopolysaccharide export system permease protein